MRFRALFAAGALPLILLSVMAGLALHRPAPPAEAVRTTRTGAAARIERPDTRRILFVILDAWRRRVALDDARMPRLAVLARRGSRGTVLTGVRTFTKACVREMMTGRPASLRDSTRNLMKDPVTEQSLLTRMNEAHLRFTLIDLIDDLQELFEQQSPPGSTPRLSSAGLPADPLDPAHDALVEAATIEALSDSRQRLVMIHLESLDLAGHIYLPDTAPYNHVLAAEDERVWRLTQQLDLERDTLFVIGDHGSDDMGHHGGPDKEARETAYLAAGAGVRSGATPLDPLDVADSLGILLGLCPPDQSVGAPQPDLLAIDRGQLKARCDLCVRNRLAAAGGAVSAETKRYFAASSFTPQVAALYKQMLATRPDDRWPPAARLIAAAAVVLGLLLLRSCAAAPGPGAAWALPGAILLLSLTPYRDSVAPFLFVATLLFLAIGERSAQSGIAVAAAAAIVVGAVAALPVADSDRIARGVGKATLILAALALAPRVFRVSRLGRAAPLVLTPLCAAVAAGLIRSDQIPGRFSPGVTLIDYALAGGILFLLAGLLLKDDAAIGLAGMALAACFFRGWPLAVFALLAALASFGPRRLQRVSFLPAALWAPLGALALLHSENGGYGFSKIDLSLSVLGIQWAETPRYGWGATVILLSYLVSMILAVRVGQTFGSDPQTSVPATSAAFLLFAGVDLLFLTLSGSSFFPRARIEEVFVFDVALGFLALLLLGVDLASERLGRRAREASERETRAGTSEALSL